MPSDRRPHLAHLDGLRAVAALYVLAHHCWFECYPLAMDRHGGGTGGLTATLTRPLAFGHWAVVLFIVLSGYCLTLPVRATPDFRLNGTGRFLANRARRILPPYFAALAVSLALASTLVATRNGSHWDVSLSAQHRGVDGRGLLWAVLLLGDKAESWQVNHAFWSVQVESKIYLLFPLLVAAARRFGAGATTVATAALAFAASNAAHRWERAGGPLLDGLNLHFVGLFAMGMGAAAARPGRRWWAAALVAAAGLTAAGVHHLGFVGTMYAGRVLDAGVGVTVAAGLVLLARSPAAWPTRALSWRPLVWVGGISYSLYLLHAPLVQVAYRYAVHPLRLPMPVQLATLIVTATALSVAAAVPFYLACERPFMSRRLRQAQPAARALATAGEVGPP